MNSQNITRDTGFLGKILDNPFNKKEKFSLKTFIAAISLVGILTTATVGNVQEVWGSSSSSSSAVTEESTTLKKVLESLRRECEDGDKALIGRINQLLGEEESSSPSSSSSSSSSATSDRALRLSPEELGLPVEPYYKEKLVQYLRNQTTPDRGNIREILEEARISNFVGDLQQVLPHLGLLPICQTSTGGRNRSGNILFYKGRWQKNDCNIIMLSSGDYSPENIRTECLTKLEAQSKEHIKFYDISGRDVLFLCCVDSMPSYAEYAVKTASSYYRLTWQVSKDMLIKYLQWVVDNIANGKAETVEFENQGARYTKPLVANEETGNNVIKKLSSEKTTPGDLESLFAYLFDGKKNPLDDRGEYFLDRGALDWIRQAFHTEVQYAALEANLKDKKFKPSDGLLYSLLDPCISCSHTPCIQKEGKIFLFTKLDAKGNSETKPQEECVMALKKKLLEVFLSKNWQDKLKQKLQTDLSSTGWPDKLQEEWQGILSSSSTCFEDINKLQGRLKERLSSRDESEQNKSLSRKKMAILLKFRTNLSGLDDYIIKDLESQKLEEGGTTIIDKIKTMTERLFSVTQKEEQGSNGTSDIFNAIAVTPIYVLWDRKKKD